MLDKRAKWGMWPQLEFNITQLFTDVNLLNAINAFFGNTGSVSERENGVGSVTFRKLEVLRKDIIPFCLKYPLIGNKAQQFIDWLELFELYEKKTYLGDSLEARDHLVDILDKMRVLNARDTRSNKRKVDRNQALVDWLRSLDGVPTLEQKLFLISKLKPKKDDGDSVDI